LYGLGHPFSPVCVARGEGFATNLEESPQFMDALGRHVLIELWDCNAAINQPESVRAAIRRGVEEIGATLLHVYVHEFSPQGVTGVATLAESHLALHSWPEHGYLAADVFTCGDQVDPLALVGVLKEWFEPGFVEVKEIERGRHPQVARCKVGACEEPDAKE
jgi:S-adenosylmethionine decarboxylase proenzyme